MEWSTITTPFLLRSVIDHNPFTNYFNNLSKFLLLMLTFLQLYLLLNTLVWWFLHIFKSIVPFPIMQSIYTNIVWLIIIDIYLIEAKINVMPLNRFECFRVGWTKFNLWYMKSTLKSTLSVFCIHVKGTAIKQTFNNRKAHIISNVKEIILCHFNKMWDYKITIESHKSKYTISCSV